MSCKENKKQVEKKDQQIECDLENELSKEDESLIEAVSLTSAQLKLKENANKGEFWKSVAETVRTDLSDALEDNQEVSRRLRFDFLGLFLKTKFSIRFLF
jgi:hypothetical protein